jgi:hypothetical protein
VSEKILISPSQNKVQKPFTSTLANSIFLEYPEIFLKNVRTLPGVKTGTILEDCGCDVING